MVTCESSALVHGYRKRRAEERCVFFRSGVDAYGSSLCRVASAAATARFYAFKKRRAEALEEETRGRLRRA